MTFLNHQKENAEFREDGDEKNRKDESFDVNNLRRKLPEP
jgi:hypothetical protein